MGGVDQLDLAEPDLFLAEPELFFAPIRTRPRAVTPDLHLPTAMPLSLPVSNIYVFPGKGSVLSTQEDGYWHDVLCKDFVVNA